MRKSASLILSVCLVFFIRPSLQAADPYRTVIAGQEERLLGFLRTFERFQEELHLAKIAEQRKALFEAVGTLLPELKAELTNVPVPADLTTFDTEWKKALAHFENAYMLLLASAPRQFLGAFLQSRREFTQGNYLLYSLREQLPTLQHFWVVPELVPQLATLEAALNDDTVETGVMHYEQTSAHASYSLYVPENYDPNQRWPLVMSLHGSQGQGDEYLLTWLRPAKSHSYIVLSPKSLARTWSIEQPVHDIRSLVAMLKTVAGTYNIDTARIFVSGLSDGGTFSYALGLHCPQLFAGIAPVAGVLPRWYPLEHAKTLPILIIHGGQDFIFPVASARATHALLQDKQFTQVTYTELPEWGHAYTYSINETHVLPWFAGLPKQALVDSDQPDTFSCPAFD